MEDVLGPEYEAIEPPLGDHGGEWGFDLAWKPVEGFPVRAACAVTCRPD